jgi:hypothetical protein
MFSFIRGIASFDINAFFRGGRVGSLEIEIGFFREGEVKDITLI